MHSLRKMKRRTATHPLWHFTSIAEVWSENTKKILVYPVSFQDPEEKKSIKEEIAFRTRKL